MHRRVSVAAAVAAAVALAAMAWPAQGVPPAAPGRNGAAGGVELVVAPNGRGHACTTTAPCALSQAQSLTRALDRSSDVTVTFTAGTYWLAAPLMLTAADGGGAGHEVTYRNAPGADPIVSGGIPVTNWSRDARTGVWSAAVPRGITSRELYVGGQRAQRTTEGPQGVWVQTSNGYLTSDPGVLRWRDPATVELVFTEGNGFWTEPRCDVAAVAPAPGGGAVVTVRQPCWSNLHIPDAPSTAAGPLHANGDNAMGGFEGLSGASAPSAVENVGSPLAPGQWYLDRASSRILYAAPGGVDPNAAGVVLPVLEQLLVGRGTLDAPVTNLRLSGLTFAYTTWAQPSGNDGFAEMQANMTLTGPNASGSDPASGRPPQGTCQYTDPPGTCPFAAWTKPPAAVSFVAAHDVDIDGCRFLHLGAAGLGFAFGSRDNRIQGNEITDVSGSGIELGDTTDPQPRFVEADGREINTGNTIADNWIHAVAAEYHGGVGIWVGYTRGTVITHNELAHLPYTAISMGWGGWHTDTAHPDNPSIAGDNLIADNVMFDYLTTLPDGGAIYTNGTQGPADPAGPAADPFLRAPASHDQMARGLTITGNVALVTMWSEFAYYNDEGSDYITYDGNVEYQAHAFAHGGCNTVGHIALVDNYWAQPIAGYICPPPPVDVTIRQHHVIPDHPGPGDIAESVLRAAGLEPAFRWLVTSQPPEVSGVGPGGPGYAAGPATQPVLVSGSGFGRDTSVWFGSPQRSTAAAAVRVLSANYLVATPPAMPPGTVDIIVATPAGVTSPHAADQYDVLPG
jgi:hypothetical protein